MSPSIIDTLSLLSKEYVSNTLIYFILDDNKIKNHTYSSLYKQSVISRDTIDWDNSGKISIKEIREMGGQYFSGINHYVYSIDDDLFQTLFSIEYKSMLCNSWEGNMEANYTTREYSKHEDNFLIKEIEYSCDCVDSFDDIKNKKVKKHTEYSITKDALLNTYGNLWSSSL